MVARIVSTTNAAHVSRHRSTHPAQKGKSGRKWRTRDSHQPAQSARSTTSIGRSLDRVPTPAGLTTSIPLLERHALATSVVAPRARRLRRHKTVIAFLVPEWALAGPEKTTCNRQPTRTPPSLDPSKSQTSRKCPHRVVALTRRA